MLFTPQQKLDFWRKVIQPDRSAKVRWLGGVAITVIGFGVIQLTYIATGKYITAITITTAIAITLYAGTLIALISATILSLFSDYFYVPPIGVVLHSAEEIGHFLFVMFLTILISVVVASLRSSLVFSNDAMLSAREATQAMETVISFVSHDLRNPLAAAKTAAQLLKKIEMTSEKVQQIRNQIELALNRANQMIEEMLDFQRLRGGKVLTNQKEECDLRETILQMIDDLKATYGDRFDLKTDKQVTGYWNALLMRRALENLINNAIKYGKPESKISVRVTQSFDDTEISVHNFGNPISPKEQKMLFSSGPYLRLSTSKYKQGWGLGLSIAQKIVQAHQGSISVASNLKEGTTFTLRIPRDTLIKTQEKARA